MTLATHSRAMRLLLPLMLTLALPVFARPEKGKRAPLDPNVAAMHPEGKWKVFKKDLYRYLARYYAGSPDARPVLADYLERRMIEKMARDRGIVVTDRDVDRWLAALDKKVKQKSGGTLNLKQVVKEQEMSWKEFVRRSRMAIMRERLARSVMVQKDRTRDPDRELDEEDVGPVIDILFQEADKQLDRSKLADGVVARILDIDITEYQYGRELHFALPDTEVVRALRDLILVAEVELLTGNDGPPRPEELAAQKKWFIDFERNRLKRQMPMRREVSDDMIDAVLAKRGLTREAAFANPAFVAQAKARGHFRRTLSADEVEAYYESNRKRYGDELEVARILVIARNQPVQQAGRKVRNLKQGKALADALWLRASQGQDFGELARGYTEDNEITKLNGGIVPFALTADLPGYQMTWQHADRLKPGEISKPFFDAGRGYVIVKLLKRNKASDFTGIRDKVRRDAAEQAYHTWRMQVLRAALKSESLLDER